MTCSICGTALTAPDARCTGCAAPPLPPVHPGARTYAVRGIGTAAIAAVALAAVLRLASWAWAMAGLALAKNARDADDLGPLNVAMAVDALLAIVAALALLVAGVLTIIWTYRVRKNLDAFPGVDPGMAAGWSIGGWLIPIANLVIPYRVVGSIARSSLNRADTPGVVTVWWSAWVAFAVGDRIASRLDDWAFDALPDVLADAADYQQYVDYYPASFGRYALVMIPMALAAVAFAMVVRTISTAQQARIEQATAAGVPSVRG